MNKLITQYAKLKIKQSEIESELEEIKSQVFDLVWAEDGQKLDTNFGSFEIRNGRKVWKYSDELTQKDMQVKEMMKLKKRQEEINGVATLEKTPQSLVFTVKKGN
jgi:hypothetical protein